MSKLITLDHLQTTAETTKEYIDSLETTLQNSIDTKADASDLENYLPLTGGTVTGSVTANEGFVGDLTGNASTADYATSAGTADSATTAESADGLTTAHALITDLESTESASFDGTVDATLGVTGVLTVANGGTGATSLDDVSVGYATTAGTAETATTATSATTADYATSAGTATSATTAESATTATNATQDGDGNVITDTYIPKSGSAGTVSYYATAADATTVDETCADAVETANAVTVSDGTSGTAWVKVIHLTGDSPTVTAGTAWNWTDGESPELESGCFVIACWLGSAGLLTYHNIG